MMKGVIAAIVISVVIAGFLAIFLPIFLLKDGAEATSATANPTVPPDHHTVHVSNLIIFADAHVDPVYDENQPGTDTVFSKIAGSGGTARIARDLKFITHCQNHVIPGRPNDWVGDDSDPSTWTFDDAELKRFQFNRTAFGFKRNTDPPVQVLAAAVRDASNQFSNDPVGVQLVLFLGDSLAHNSAYGATPGDIQEGTFQYVHNLMHSTAQLNQVSGSIPVYLGCVGNNSITHDNAFFTGSSEAGNLFMTNVFDELGMLTTAEDKATFAHLGCFRKAVTDVGIISINSNLMINPDANPTFDATKEGDFFNFFQEAMDGFQEDDKIKQILMISHHPVVPVPFFPSGWSEEMRTKAEAVVNSNTSTPMTWLSAHLHDTFTSSIGSAPVPVLGFASITGSQSGGRGSYYTWNIDSNEFSTRTIAASLNNHDDILATAQFETTSGRVFNDGSNLCSNTPANCVACP